MFKKGYKKGKAGAAVKFAQASGATAYKFMKKGYPTSTSEKIGKAVASKGKK